MGTRFADTLAAGVIHRWHMQLEEDDYAAVEAEQKGVDLVLRIFDPSGELRSEADSPTGAFGTEESAWIADSEGVWTAELAASEGSVGGYEIAWTEGRPAKSTDRLSLEADSLTRLAEANHLEARYADAKVQYERALAIREAALGPEHPDVAESLNGLAVLQKDGGRYEDAEPLFEQALDILKAALGPEHPDVARSLNDFAALYDDQGRYARAELLYDEARLYLEAALGPNNPDVATNINNLAVLYYRQGRYLEAESLFKRALQIDEAVLGPNHTDLATDLANLAVLFRHQGRYGEAEPLFERALAIDEAALGPDHPFVAGDVQNLAALYERQGRYDEAEPLYERALRIRESTLGPDHPRVATVLTNLAVLYRHLGRYAEAEPFLERALQIRERALGSDHAHVAVSLHNLAALYEKRARFEEALQLYERALAVRERALGSMHPDVGLTLRNLASLHATQGRSMMAESLLNRAIGIFDETTGLPYARASAYALRGRVRRSLGDKPGALDDLTTALFQLQELRPQVGGGERTRAGLFGRYTEDFDLMVRWQLEADEVEAAFEYAERGRARVLLDQLAAGKIDLRASIPEEVRAELEEREAHARARLAEYQQRITVLRGRDDLSTEVRRDRMAALEDSLRKADAEYRQVYESIKNASPLWRDLLTSGGQPVPLTTVQRRVVPRTGLLILYEIGAEGSYVFFVSPAGQEPEALPLQVAEEEAAILGTAAGPLTSRVLEEALGAEAEGNSVGGGWLGDRGGERSSDERESAERLHALFRLLVPELLWKRLEAASEVIVIPDGWLHQLPFEALVVKLGASSDGSRYWLDEGPVIRYAPSVTALFNITQRPPTRALGATLDILSLSNPIYDPGEVALALEGIEERPETGSAPETGPTEPLALATSEITRDSYERAGGSLARLPGTALETEALRAAFGADRAMGEVVVLLGAGANEPHMRSEVTGKRYLHLATHGLVDERRGVLFAALALTPPPGETTDSEDDGFLQLYEIYDLELPDVELAVLSACESNVGTRVEGEGVFALSRGFLAAGARRVIASQWSVNDASTAALIGAFFRQIAEAEQSGERIDYALALRDAKRTVRSQDAWEEPYYWAPFILTGQP